MTMCCHPSLKIFTLFSFQTGVTVTDREVKTGTLTTLTCSLTELSVEVEISWWDETNRLADGKNICLAQIEINMFLLPHVTIVSRY